MIEKLKIQYVFTEGRDPHKDLNKSIESIAIDLFIEEYYDYILPEVIKKTSHEVSKDDFKKAVDYFINNYLEDNIKQEPEILQKLITHPESIKQLKQKIKEAMSSGHYV